MAPIVNVPPNRIFSSHNDFNHHRSYARNKPIDQSGNFMRSDVGNGCSGHDEGDLENYAGEG
jgi:hypothetical protein